MVKQASCVGVMGVDKEAVDSVFAALWCCLLPSAIRIGPSHHARTQGIIPYFPTQQVCLCLKDVGSSEVWSGGSLGL